MNLGELKQFLEDNPKLPDNMEIYIHADHGQNVEPGTIQHEMVYTYKHEGRYTTEINIIHPDDYKDYDPNEADFQGALVFWGY